VRNTCGLVLAAASVLAACGDGAEPVAPRPEANVILDIPGDSPGPPFYSLIQPGWFPMTEEWAAVMWLRDPGCVPDDFNILQFFDPPPRPFFCALTIEGHEIWNTDPPDPTVGPKNIIARGLGAVPLYFVSTADLLPAIGDGQLTITDLEAMPSLLVGFADFFTLSQQTGVARGRPGEGTITISSRGHLTDGRAFFFQTAEGPPKKDPIAHTRIEFR